MSSNPPSRGLLLAELTQRLHALVHHLEWLITEQRLTPEFEFTA